MVKGGWRFSGFDGFEIMIRCVEIEVCSGHEALMRGSGLSQECDHDTENVSCTVIVEGLELYG